MRANLTISLATGLAIHVASEICEAAERDVDAGKILGDLSQLAAINLRDLVCGMPKAERSLILSTVREYTQCYLRLNSFGRDDRNAVRRRIFAALRYAKSTTFSNA